MTNTTTKDQAIDVLRFLTAEHALQPYFMDADVIYNDGFFCIDFKVDGEKWRQRENKMQIPPQINRVPICVLVYG